MMRLSHVRLPLNTESEVRVKLKEIAAGAAVGRRKYSRIVFAPMIESSNVFTDGGMESFPR